MQTSVPLGSSSPAPVKAPRRGEPRSLPRIERIVQARDALQRRLLAAADALAALTAVFVCVSVLGDDGIRWGTLGIALLVVLVGKVTGLYDRDEMLINKTTADEGPALFQLATLLTLLTVLLQGSLVDGTLGKAQVVVLWLAFFAFAFAGRFTARQVACRLTGTERCLLVGTEDVFDRLASKLSDATRAELVGRANPVPGEDVDFIELRSLVDELDVHRVILAPDHRNPEAILDMVRAAKGLGVRVTVLPSILEVVGSSVEFDDIGGMPLLGVRSFGLSRSSRLVKRCFDLIVTTVGLLVAAPVMAVIAVAIRADSRGPLLFRQTRVGRDGRSFCIYKFRTMVPGADELKADLHAANEADGLFKIADDPRMTRAGRLLRRTSLDELPQLLNVLRGEMSLVGPRPLALDEDARITGFDRRRLNLTPGMTGHWQILGSARVPLYEMVKIDYLYVANWTLWADIKLLVRTIPYMLRRRGL